MGKFDNYENVKSRKFRFINDFFDGRIVAELMQPEKIEQYALFKATVFKNKDDQEKNLPLGVGYAMETRDLKLKVSGSGKSYESVNFTSWCENCEESAVGRALDNAGYASKMACSREEVDKAVGLLNRAQEDKEPDVNAQVAPQNNPQEAQFIPPSDKQKSFYFSLLKGKYGSTEAIPDGVLNTARQLGKMAMAKEIDKMQKEIEGE